MAGAPDTVTRAEMEFAVKDAVQKAVEATTRAIMEKMAQAPAGAPAPDQHFAEALAMALAGIANQGTGKKVVPPEVLAKRAHAKDRMVELILKYRQEKTVPVYELVAGTFLDDRWIPAAQITAGHQVIPTEIRYRGIPNSSMRPANDAARAIWEEYCDWIGSHKGGATMSRVPVNRSQEVSFNGRVMEASPMPDLDQDDLHDLVTDGARPEPNPRMGEVEVVGRNKPGKAMNVLGTIAEPARQTSF